MNTKPDDYERAIQRRATALFPAFLDRLKVHKHPRKDEIKDAVVAVAVVYFRLSKPQSRKQKAAMMKIAADARRLQAALSAKTLRDDQREELHAMIDAHLRAHPAHTLGHIFTHPSSVQRLKVQLDQVMRAFGKRERSAPLVAKRDRLAPPPAKRRLCGNCLICLLDVLSGLF